MASGQSKERQASLRVAKWLVDKGRPDEAVTILAAWAASGENDSEGQQLLAEALRIDPSARLSQMAGDASRRYDIAECVRRMEDLYDDVLRGRAGA